MGKLRKTGKRKVYISGKKAAETSVLFIQMCVLM